MELRPVDPDDAAAVAELTRVYHAVDAEDAPHLPARTPAQVRNSLKYGWDLDTPQQWLVHDGEEPVGWASYQISKWDNPHMAHLSLGVRPGRRRRGLGTAILDALVSQARQDGCRTAMTHGWDSSPAADFAEA